jgi:hypothetical protein
MNCPNCNTPNEASNQFCVNCGAALNVPPQTTRSSGQYLGILTARLAIALLGVWIIRSVLLSLSFVEELQIPGVNVTASMIINALIFLVVIFLLIDYARNFGALWPLAFPGYPELGYLITALIYVGVLSAIYAGVKPILLGFVSDPEVMQIFQIVLALLALIILARAAVIAYHGLADWLSGLVSGYKQIAKNSAPLEEK